ncbi:MAG: histone deacetylase [Deltaproteobacteria bacterium]|nr:histone deacetylase [Deltaproteobacteria bacterium]
MSPLPVTSNRQTRVGIVRDERYLLHKPGHTHPEHPNRLKAVYRMLDGDFSGDLIPIDPQPATLEHLELVHTPSYVKRVLKTADHRYTSLSPDTPASAETYLASWLAVGGCVKALDRLMDRSVDVAFCLIRPPGHHALKDRAGGFCVFNNIGIAARYAMQAYGLRRILIIDFDIHHGNGIHDLFHSENEILYFSTHDPMLYPYTGDWEDVGEGAGTGYTINIPLPRDLTDGEFVHLYQAMAGPVMRAYQPQLILAAAGFDAHEEDPIGRSHLSEKVFGRLARLLMEWRAEIGDPPILFALEGGYCPRALAASVKEVVLALLTPGHVEDAAGMETQQVVDMVARARAIHQGYGVW